MHWNAYAKINLSLDVGLAREDGYHTVDSVMQTISLWDRVFMKRNTLGTVRLRTNRSYLPTGEKNTAWKAASLFFRETGIGSGIDISIEKRIPGRAGMGGGSADAAAVLRGMNQLYNADLSRNKLLELAAQVGADVPFCLVGGTLRCGGIGEKLTPAPPLPDCLLVICKPPDGISTPRAYSMIDNSPPPAHTSTPQMISALETGDIKLIANNLGNRFDEVVPLASVRRIKSFMTRYGALGTLMTGSGSAVYGIFSNTYCAKQCMRRLKGYGEVFLAHPINRLM